MRTLAKLKWIMLTAALIAAPLFVIKPLSVGAQNNPPAQIQAVKLTVLSTMLVGSVGGSYVLANGIVPAGLER